VSVTSAIDNLKDEMQKAGIKSENGLGTELFLFSSTLIPVVNVDLLLTNSKHEILLAWRDDPHTGKGWHIPGGCVRFKEKLMDCVQKTAITEFGAEVICRPKPIKVFEIFTSRYRDEIEDQKERAHFITLVYACKFKDETMLLERQKSEYENKPGYLKWFSELPEDLLDVQECYRESWTEINKKIW